MSIIVKLRRSIDRSWLRQGYDSTPTIFHRVLYVIPMMIALGATEIAKCTIPIQQAYGCWAPVPLPLLACFSG
jgi:hypothetical protein